VPQRLEATSVSHRRLVTGALVVGATVAALTIGTTAAGADTGWSRAPSSGVAGGTVQVASSASTLCQWVQPATVGDPPPQPGDPATSSTTAPPAPATRAAAAPTDTVYDGTQVRVRLSRDGVDLPLADFPVTEGGAWAGTVTLPETQPVTPGDYQLFVKCVIDRPELDGVRTYDFDPLTFTVVESPPPTTVEGPVELVPPITAVNQVQVQGAQLTRPAAAPATPAVANTAATVPTLPNTGDGTLETALAGLGALLVGGAALWWGARHARHTGADLLD
jgi:LPXTG-motif cell wall-anchored protein